MKKFYFLALSAIMAMAVNAITPKLTYLGPNLPAKIQTETQKSLLWISVICA